MTKNRTQTTYDPNGRDTRQIEEDIRHTRHEMDETIDELEDRLKPKHLLNEAVAFFRSSSGDTSVRDVTKTCKSAGNQVLKKVKQHPIPAALCAAGLLWLLFEDDNEASSSRSRSSGLDGVREHSGSYVDARTGEPYDDSYGKEWKQEVAAWHDDYDWANSDVPEETWTERTERGLAEVGKILSDAATSSADKVRRVAAQVLAASGHKRRQIHSRLASLESHSGSYVDARTGEPYDETYGREWANLAAADVASHPNWDEEMDETWSETASRKLAEWQKSLADSSRSTKQKMGSLAADVGELFMNAKESAKDAGGSVWSSIRGATQSVSSTAAELGRQTRLRSKQGARVAAEGISRGYQLGRDRAAEAVEEYPLAVGAACIGLGLLAGALLPSTRQEDRLLGESSDDLKRQAREMGKEAYQRAGHVAERTAHAVKEEAERQGLMPGQLREKAKQFASSVTKTAKEEASDAAPRNLRKSVESVAREATNAAETEAKREVRKMKSDKA